MKNILSLGLLALSLLACDVRADAFSDYTLTNTLAPTDRLLQSDATRGAGGRTLGITASNLFLSAKPIVAPLLVNTNFVIDCGRTDQEFSITNDVISIFHATNATRSAYAPNGRLRIYNGGTNRTLTLPSAWPKASGIGTTITMSNGWTIIDWTARGVITNSTSQTNLLITGLNRLQ